MRCVVIDTASTPPPGVAVRGYFLDANRVRILVDALETDRSGPLTMAEEREMRRLAEVLRLLLETME